MPDPCTDPHCPHRVTDPPIPHFHTQTPGDGFTDILGTDLANRLVSALRVTDADSELPPVPLCDEESCPLTTYYGVVHTHLGSLQPTLLRGHSDSPASEQDGDTRPTHTADAVSAVAHPSHAMKTLFLEKAKRALRLWESARDGDYALEAADTLAQSLQDLLSLENEK